MRRGCSLTRRQTALRIEAKRIVADAGWAQDEVASHLLRDPIGHFDLLGRQPLRRTDLQHEEAQEFHCWGGRRSLTMMNVHHRLLATGELGCRMNRVSTVPQTGWRADVVNQANLREQPATEQ